MKRKYLYAVIIIIAVVCLSACLFISSRYQKINIFAAKGFDKASSTPIVSISDRKTLREISLSFLTSKRIKGALNTIQPEYVMEIYSFNNQVKRVYLWLGTGSNQGMYIYSDNTHAGYSFSYKNTERLRNAITAR